MDNMNNSESLRVTPAEQELVKQKFLSSVYAWMAFALAITGVVAYFTSTSLTLLRIIFASRYTYLALIIGELVLVGFLSARIRTMAVKTAMLMFIVYAIVNGLTMSAIFIVYTQSSIAHVFGIAALMFGAMSLFGVVTKKNLAPMGRYLFMGLIGLIIASLVNLFLQSSQMSWIISIVTVVLFTALTAYDTQKILKLSNIAESNDTYKKVAIIGALHLYLDFINIFLGLLRLFGSRR